MSLTSSSASLVMIIPLHLNLTSLCNSNHFIHILCNYSARPVITKPPKQFQRSKPGETIVFACNYTGDPEPTPSWSKDGVAIKDEGRFLIHTEKGYSELEVDKLVYSDSGTYQIALSNAYGSAWVGAILDMNCEFQQCLSSKISLA